MGIEARATITTGKVTIKPVAPYDMLKSSWITGSKGPRATVGALLIAPNSKIPKMRIEVWVFFIALSPVFPLLIVFSFSAFLIIFPKGWCE
jgi:hypothetical protein